MDAMAAIRKTFFQECEEQLAELESGLIAIEQGDTDPERINAVFRAVHSVKGGAGAFDLEVLVRFAHVFETALDEVRNGRLAPDQHVLKIMLRAADVLADLVSAARDETSIDDARCKALTEELEKVAGDKVHAEIDPEDDISTLVFQPVQVNLDMLFGMDGSAEPELNNFIVRFAPKPTLYANANEAAVLMRELGRLGDAQVRCDHPDLPLLPDLDPEGAYLSWTIDLKTEKGEAEIREVFEFVDGDCELSIERVVAPASAEMPHSSEASVSDATITPQVSDQVTIVELQTNTPAAQRTEATVSALPTAQATIRVDLDRVDRLINLVGELVINQAMLAQRVSEAGLARSSAVAEGLDELEDLSREIQEALWPSGRNPSSRYSSACHERSAKLPTQRASWFAL